MKYLNVTFFPDMAHSIQSVQFTLGPSDQDKEKTASQKLPSLFVQKWVGEGATQKKTKRVLLIMHGYGEHGGRYKHFPDFLGEDFDSFYALDQRGHGRSGGSRGDIDSFDSFLEDALVFIGKVKQLEKGKKLFLFGHSFGGLVALALLSQHSKRLPLDGAIISAPALSIAMKIPRYKRILADVLTKTFAKLQLASGLNPSYLSRDPAVVERYVNDRLVHDKMTPRMFLAMNEAMAKVTQEAASLEWDKPLLFLIPGQDRLINSQASIDFYEKLNSRQKKLCVYPDFYHEILNEMGKEQAFQDISHWMRKV